MPLVLDASVALAWAFEDEATEYGDRILARLTSDAAYVPSIWALEVGNTLLSGERRGRIAEADTRRFVALLSSLPIRTDTASNQRALSSVLQIARSESLTSYDASYVELALREGIPLATQDTRLLSVVTRLGIGLAQ